MAESGEAAAPAEFWRCSACGTPNPARSYLSRCLGCGGRRALRCPAAAVVGEDEVDGPPARRGAWIAPLSWGYAAVVLLVLALIRWVGDAWWGVALLLLMPRWLFLFPPIALAAAAAATRRPLALGVPAATALVVAGPLMALSVPTSRLWDPPAPGEAVRVMTFNRGMSRLDAERMIETVERERVSVICFQELMTPNPRLESYLAQGWHRDASGHVFSRLPIVAEIPRLRDNSTTEQRYAASLWRIVVRSPGGTEFLVACVHMPTVRFGLARVSRGDLGRIRLHVEWWREQLGRVIGAIDASAGDRPVLIGGDFNLPADDTSMAALRGRFVDGFLEAGWGYGYTRPTDAPWVRIDHLLATPDIRFARCWVGPDLGSDHLPLLAEIVLPPPAEPSGSPR